jgi:hypothetical protein
MRTISSLSILIGLRCPKMREFYRDDRVYSQRLYAGPPRKRYGFFSFLFDVTLTLFTGGLWLIWIFVREMRNR